jgi:hypothetical protein
MKTLSIIVAIILILHGLIHLMGTVTYMKLSTIQGLTYKTTLLAGRWNLGESGIAVYGALWAAAAVGFVLAATAMSFGWNGWKLVLTGVTIFSLALTALDWIVASAGAILNIVILAWLWLAPNIVK